MYAANRSHNPGYGSHFFSSFIPNMLPIPLALCPECRPRFECQWHPPSNHCDATRTRPPPTPSPPPPPTCRRRYCPVCHTKADRDKAGGSKCIWHVHEKLCSSMVAPTPLSSAVRPQHVTKARTRSCTRSRWGWSSVLRSSVTTQRALCNH